MKTHARGASRSGTQYRLRHLKRQRRRPFPISFNVSVNQYDFQGLPTATASASVLVSNILKSGGNQNDAALTLCADFVAKVFLHP